VIKEIASGNIDVGQAAVSHSWSELEKGHKPSVAQFAHANFGWFRLGSDRKRRDKPA